MKKVFHFILIALCPFYLKGQIIKPEVLNLNYPEIDEISEIELGNSLISLEKKETYEGFKLEQKIVEKRLLGNIHMLPDNIYYYFSNSQWDYYRCTTPCMTLYNKKETEVKNVFEGGLKISKGKTKVGLWYYIDEKHPDYKVFLDIYKRNNLTYNPMNDIGESINTDPVLTPTKVILIKDPIFKQEFIYNGKVGTSIKFIYREFVNDMARPSFTQEISYDLEEGNVVGFKGMKIEIIKATNTNIKYYVLSHFKDK